MNNDNSNAFRINAKYILITAVAVLFTWLIHEGAHWLMGELLGYKMHMTLNTASSTQPYASIKDENLISAAGPAITLFQAMIAFIMLRGKWQSFLYPFLMVCLYMRMLAFGLSFLNPNDEARISANLNIGTFTLPLIVSILLFVLVYSITRKYNISKKFNGITVGLIMLFSSVVILADQFLGIQII